tara:strand:- start:1918 stop:2877 length:960 start_codon:yes stop_codon:yes gene_type:complete
MDKTRRTLFGKLAAIIAVLPLAKLASAEQTLGLSQHALGNFYYIYQNSQYRQSFLPFLQNVFHLYPDKSLHQLINAVTHEAKSDEKIYQRIQQNLADISPALANFRYALPALNKQKKVMAAQSQQLLADRNNFQGYLEIGTTGRYIDALEEQLNINGSRYFIAERSATFSPVDMIDRGQILKAGDEQLLDNYQLDISSSIASNSIDLVTVFIGFHHCPIHLREPFITGIRDVMTDNGVLLLRDHDAHNERQLRTVALAHDVFNMGTHESWHYNQQELRLFYSLEALNKMMTRFGFKTDGHQLFQSGDPTKNALMAYTKS